MKKITEFDKKLKKVFSSYKDPDFFFAINKDISRFGDWVHEVNSIKNIKNSYVLSSGCGTAGDLYYFLKYSPKKVYGIETNKNYVSLAKLRLKQFKKNKYSISSYSGKILPYNNNFFDIIYSSHVIEHTDNINLYLEELYRVLKPNGIIFIELPNRMYFKEQHTNIILLHWLSKNVISIISNFLKKLGFHENSKKIIELNSLNLPYSRDVFRFFLNQKKSRILYSFFHSHDNKNVNCYFKLPSVFINKTTYRVVVSKKE